MVVSLDVEVVSEVVCCEEDPSCYVAVESAKSDF